jgi:hypothetical protein
VERQEFVEVLAFWHLFLRKQNPGKLVSGTKLSSDTIKCT